MSWFIRASRDAARAFKRQDVDPSTVKDDEWPFMSLEVGGWFFASKHATNATSLRGQAQYRTNKTGRVFSVKKVVGGWRVTRKE